MEKNKIIELILGNIKVKIHVLGLTQQATKTNPLTHSHASFEFHTMLRYGANLEFDGESSRLSEGESVLIFPGVFHRFSEQDDGSAIASFSFFIERCVSKKEDYYSLIAEKINPKNPSYLLFRNELAAEYIKKIMIKIFSSDPFASEEIRALFILLFSAIFSEMTQADAKKPYTAPNYENFDARTLMIENYLNANYTKNIKLYDLAGELYLSTKQTERMVQQIYGRSFLKQVLRMRIKSAKELLSESELEIRAIAEKVGYQSYNGFYLAFKRVTGMTPEEYRDAKGRKQ